MINVSQAYILPDILINFSIFDATEDSHKPQRKANIKKNTKFSLFYFTSEETFGNLQQYGIVESESNSFYNETISV